MHRLFDANLSLLYGAMRSGQQMQGVHERSRLADCNDDTARYREDCVAELHLFDFHFSRLRRRRYDSCDWLHVKPHGCGRVRIFFRTIHSQSIRLQIRQDAAPVCPSADVGGYDVESVQLAPVLYRCCGNGWNTNGRDLQLFHAACNCSVYDYHSFDEELIALANQP